MWIEFVCLFCKSGKRRQNFIAGLIAMYCQGVVFAGPFAIVPGRFSLGEPMLNVVDLQNGYNTTQIWLKSAPYNILLHPNGRYAYLSSMNVNDVIQDGINNTAIFDLKSKTYLQTFEVSGSPLGSSDDGAELYFGMTGRLVVLDLATNKSNREFPVDGAPALVFFGEGSGSDIKILYQKEFVGATPRYGIYDAGTNKIYDLAIASYVDPAIERRRAKLFLSGLPSGKVYVIDIADPTQVTTVDIGGMSQGGIAPSTNSDEVFVATSGSPKNTLNTDIVVLDGLNGAILRRMRIPGEHTFTHLNTSEYFPDDLYVATQENFFIVDKRSGAIKYTLPHLLGNNWAQFSPSLGTYVPRGTKAKIDSNRLFNWVEDKYPQIFSSPQRPFSATAEGYYYRCYSGSNTCLGTRDGNVHFLPPGAGMAGITNLGPMGDYLPAADADGY